ncbi:hypothetical protein E4U14_008112 [Claviceps sp. LM454 group G7]|nr:hypothetical protein E4U14_008112 [Claviceps sp. LM454 group G7]
MSAADHLFNESPLTSDPDEPFGKSPKRPDEDSDVVFADLFDDGSATRIKDLVSRDSADEKRAPHGGGSIDNEELDGSLESPRNGDLFTHFGNCPTESHKQKRKEKEMLRGEFATAVYTFSWEFASTAHALSSVDEASLNHKKRLTPPAPKLPLAPMMPLTPIRSLTPMTPVVLTTMIALMIMKPIINFLGDSETYYRLVERLVP